MASNNQPAQSLLYALNSQTLLLGRLPAELRNHIYGLVLRSSDIINLDKSFDSKPLRLRKIKKPALLQVSRQIRTEAEPVFYRVGPSFQGEVTVDSLPRIAKWAASLDADELRGIRYLNIHFRLSASDVARGIDEKLAGVLAAFSTMLWDMYGRGLGKSAVHVAYTTCEFSEPAAKRFTREVNQFVFMMDVKRFRNGGRLP